MIEIQLQAGERPYFFRAGWGLLQTAGPALIDAGLRGKVALIADARVFDLWGETACRSLADAGLATTVFQIPPGETSKTLWQANELYGALIDAGFERGDTVMALGGGMVGDLAGFVAATYLRGLAFVQLPTTLLAQVDASIGGKVAVDHPQGKNLIGAFHQPRLVLADTATIASLSARDRWSGLAEVVKAALIADEPFVAFLEEHLDSLGGGDAPAAILEEAIGRAARIKAAIVGADEREGGLRRVLNFGHTLGHALELCAGYEHITHGEAVVVGMRAAVAVSRAAGLLGEADAARASRLLGRFALPAAPRPSREALLAAMKRDKKSEGGAVRFIVLSALGSAEILPSLGPELLELALDRVIETSRSWTADPVVPAKAGTQDASDG